MPASVVPPITGPRSWSPETWPGSVVVPAGASGGYMSDAGLGNDHGHGVSKADSLAR